MLIVLFRRTTRSGRGKIFERLTYRALKKLAQTSSGGFWYKRLYDYKTYVAINPALTCIKQPADFMACQSGRLYFIECKSSKGNRYALKFIKAHQEDSAVITERAGAVYWFLIYHWEDEIFAFRPVDWLQLKRHVLQTGYVSASWEDIRRFATTIIERKERAWDFNVLFETKKYMTRKMTKRDIQFIFSKDFPAVALYDGEEDEIIILTDIWTKKCWKKWSRNLTKFIKFIIDDLNISIIHELIHWATPEYEDLTKNALKKWENKVERMAQNLAFFKLSVNVINIKETEEI